MGAVRALRLPLSTDVSVRAHFAGVCLRCTTRVKIAVYYTMQSAVC